MSKTPTQYKITVKIDIEEKYGDYGYTRSMGGSSRETVGLPFTSIKTKIIEMSAEALSEVKEIIQPKLDELKELAAKEAAEQP